MFSVSQINPRTMTKVMAMVSKPLRPSCALPFPLLGVMALFAGCALGRDAHAPVNTAGGGLTTAGVSFQAVLSGQYLTAINNGGGAIDATASVVQAWEIF